MYANKFFTHLLNFLHFFRILFETVFYPCNYFISKYNPIRVREKKLTNECSLVPGVDKWQLPDCSLSTVIIIHTEIRQPSRDTTKRKKLWQAVLSVRLAIIVSNPIALTDSDDDFEVPSNLRSNMCHACSQIPQ